MFPQREPIPPGQSDIVEPNVGHRDERWPSARTLVFCFGNHSWEFLLVRNCFKVLKHVFLRIEYQELPFWANLGGNPENSSLVLAKKSGSKTSSYCFPVLVLVVRFRLASLQFSVVKTSCSCVRVCVCLRTKTFVFVNKTVVSTLVSTPVTKDKRQHVIGPEEMWDQKKTFTDQTDA